MWNIQGVVPPVAVGEAGHSTNRSPYLVNIIQFVKDFALSAQRIDILIGFLEYRQALYSAGITTGFQWINGSFVENVEVLAGRAPNDIDVVTFSNLCNTVPNFEDWVSQNLPLFSAPQAKTQYRVDCYWVDMDAEFNADSIERCTYWYSMWSHQKETNLWKGFFQMTLSPEDDKRAAEYLTSLNTESNHA
ncbi:DUF6932 family protein [Psychrobacter fozii]|uniref:Uncharacterized protein n=1 Tax=Psychrobacter fozii TaxID=198480 RepID=A0A2V4UL82_9GAMM|nr:hypothetical protein [Psychrobacter fozii]PYE40937.1 hypothetical protein DFP82_101253 [Psychrobacter fozii]